MEIFSDIFRSHQKLIITELIEQVFRINTAKVSAFTSKFWAPLWNSEAKLNHVNILNVSAWFQMMKTLSEGYSYWSVPCIVELTLYSIRNLRYLHVVIHAPDSNQLM